MVHCVCRRPDQWVGLLSQLSHQLMGCGFESHRRQPSQSGGMADAAVLKTVESDFMRVRLPPLAPMFPNSSMVERLTVNQ